VLSLACGALGIKRTQDASKLQISKNMNPYNFLSMFAVGESFDYVLFKIAISFAETGLSVWFISPETFDKAPGNIKPPDKEVLQLITFIYLKDFKDIITHLNTIHLWHKPPNVIIIKGFEYYCNFYCDFYNPLQAALVTTSLLDSAAVCAMKKDKQSFLLVTCSEPSESHKNNVQTIKDLYFPNYVHKIKDDDLFNHVTKVFK